MSERLGAEFDGLISGIGRFGIFVKLDDTGADGLLPMSALGGDYFRYDEKTSTLTGARSREKFRIGQRVSVKLEEAAPLTGGLRFSLVGRAAGTAPGKSAGRSRGKKPGTARKGNSRKKAARSKARKPR